MTSAQGGAEVASHWTCATVDLGYQAAHFTAGIFGVRADGGWVGMGSRARGSCIVVPYYSSVASPAIPSASSTLVAVNGVWVVVPAGIPAVVAVVVAIALHRKCARGSEASGRLAWLLAWLLVGFSVESGFSIGVFVVPLAVLLVVAASLTPSSAHAASPALSRGVCRSP